jgi:hypothetical protein
MERDGVFQIWGLLDQNLGLNVVEARTGMHRRTVQRYKTAKESFARQRPLAEIAQATGWTETTVLRLRRWWERSPGNGGQQVERRGSAQDPLYDAAVTKHDEDLWRVMGLVKEYLEQVDGETPSEWLEPWDPPAMDAKRLKDLFSHLADPELDLAFQNATRGSPSVGRTDAGRQALELLREVLATRYMPGSCDHCLPDRKATIA